MTFEAVIGLEVHAQLQTRTKLFCGCSASFGDPPNTNICPVCLGLPGALPVPNRRAIELAMRAAAALDCIVQSRSVFARKSYFYPDLAKGYQISQFELPLNLKGKLAIMVDGVRKVALLNRIHVEEDAAKNMHGVAGETVVDFNRGGVPLIEIVGEPDLRSSDEAEAFLRALREVLMATGVNDGNLEEGSFRCDANVSIRPQGSTTLGTRVEIKNINSFRFVRKAIEFEIARQEALVSTGGTVVQETRTYSDAQGRTLSMRGKEEAHDYRYFPDPDLPPLVVTPEEIARIAGQVPELPVARRARWETLGLTEQDARVLSGHPAIAAYFDEALTSLQPSAAKRLANFIQAEVLRNVTTHGLQADFPAPAAAVAELLELVEGGTINGKIAKAVFAIMADTGKSPSAIIDEQDLAQVTDLGAIEAVVREVIEAHPSQTELYRGGKTAILGFLVGQVMRATRGQADPKAVNETLRKLLDA